MIVLRTAAVALLMACGAAHAATDWPMLMGGPAHAGVVQDAGRTAVEQLALAWQFRLDAAISASPVAVGNQLYAGAENGNLYAIDLDTRQLRWLFHSRGGIASTPAVADGVLYFLSRDGRFHALDAASGAPLWQFRTGGEALFAAHGMYGLPLDGEPAPDPWDFYLSSPLVHGGVVYFGSSDQCVYALDARTGKPRWVYKTGGVVHSSPALAGANIVVGSWDGALYALDAASGELRWRLQTETEQKVSIALGIQASPSVDGDTVYAGSRDGHVYAVAADSGKVRWRYDAQGSWVVSTAAVDDQQVYFGTSDTGLLVALDKTSGKERYRFDTGVWTYASPLRVGDALVAASMKGEAFALDAATGRLRWRYQTEESRRDAYGIIDKASGKFDTKRLYGSAPHELYAALEHVKRLGAFAASPLWHRGQLILATEDGRLLFFTAPAGGKPGR
ncbi:outer membrane protein assembly factor BamB family protein [Rugamonas fusca]|nr:PQQ-binding-like beta-propeller repeat protein [Rugamonas fusca]